MKNCEQIILRYIGVSSGIRGEISSKIQHFHQYTTVYGEILVPVFESANFGQMILVSLINSKH